ncbi:MAG: type II toxin-antitoxin system RelE/ParE family toxin [Anaerolineaceae bacterium]
MAWIIEYLKEAEADLQELDHSQQIQVLKSIKKVAANPLPSSQGGYGKPLGNHLSGNPTGYLKIKLLKLGLRVIYRLIEEKGVMRIIIISVREDEKVYKMLQERLNR